MERGLAGASRTAEVGARRRSASEPTLARAAKEVG